MLDAARQRTTDPVAARDAARDAMVSLKAGALVAAAASVNLAKLALMTKDRNAVYRGDLTPIKRVAWSQPIPLERVKQIGSATDATVNDVLVASVTGGLRRYMIEAVGETPARDIRATVPVNLRPADAPLTLGNKFSLVFLTLPISLPDPLGRLYEVKRRMDALKRSPEPLLVYEILNLLGMIPGPASRQDVRLVRIQGLLHPHQRPRTASARLLRRHAHRPHDVLGSPIRGVGVGVSILSYDGDVTIGLMVDEALVPDPERIVHEIYADLLDIEDGGKRSRLGHRLTRTTEVNAPFSAIGI